MTYVNIGIIVEYFSNQESMSDLLSVGCKKISSVPCVRFELILNRYFFSSLKINFLYIQSFLLYRISKAKNVFTFYMENLDVLLWLIGIAFLLTPSMKVEKANTWGKEADMVLFSLRAKVVTFRVSKTLEKARKECVQLFKFLKCLNSSESSTKTI